MKKIVMIFMGIITVLLLTGCGMKYNAKMTIESNGKVTMSIISAKDNDLIDFNISQEKGNSQEEHSDADRWEYLEKHNDHFKLSKFQPSRYSGEDYKGYLYQRNFESIDAITGGKIPSSEVLSGEVSSEEVSSREVPSGEVPIWDFLRQEVFFTKDDDRYLLHVLLQDESGDLADARKYNDMEGINIMTVFQMTLPQKAEKNNATEVSEDGLTYTWDLLKTNEIEIAFQMPKESSGEQEQNQNNQRHTEEGTSINLIPVFIFLGGVLLLVVVVANKYKNK